MKHFYTLLLILIYSAAYAQSNFVSGYFIDNAGNKTEALINNKYWPNTPKEFEYQNSPNSKIFVVSIEDVKEVGVGERYKFQRFTAKYDHQRKNIGNLSQERNPQFKEETLFLRVLLEGTATLYSYSRSGDESFFYSLPSQDPAQLIYRPYNVGDGKIRYNAKYKQDLFNDFLCDDITLTRIEKLEYSGTKLVKFFKDYNECIDSGYDIYLDERKKGDFNFTVKAGINFTNYKISEPPRSYYNASQERTYRAPEQIIYQNADFEPNLRVGFELEYIFPFLNNKWALFTEPNYSHYTTEKNIFLPGNGLAPNPIRPGIPPDFIKIEYSAIELPLGFRRYVHFQNNNKLFINAAAGAVYRFNTYTTEDWGEGRTRQRPDFFESKNIGFSLLTGVGFTHRTGISLEVRFYPILEAQRNPKFEMNHNNSFALIAGYRIF